MHIGLLVIKQVYLYILICKASLWYAHNGILMYRNYKKLIKMFTNITQRLYNSVICLTLIFSHKHF